MVEKNSEMEELAEEEILRIIEERKRKFKAFLLEKSDQLLEYHKKKGVPYAVVTLKKDEKTSELKHIWEVHYGFIFKFALFRFARKHPDIVKKIGKIYTFNITDENKDEVLSFLSKYVPTVFLDLKDKEDIENIKSFYGNYITMKDKPTQEDFTHIAKIADRIKKIEEKIKEQSSKIPTTQTSDIAQTIKTKVEKPDKNDIHNKLEEGQMVTTYSSVEITEPLIELMDGVENVFKAVKHIIEYTYAYNKLNDKSIVMGIKASDPDKFRKVVDELGYKNNNGSIIKRVPKDKVPEELNKISDVLGQKPVVMVVDSEKVKENFAENNIKNEVGAEL